MESYEDTDEVSRLRAGLPSYKTWPCGHPYQAAVVADMTGGGLSCIECWEAHRTTTNWRVLGVLLGMLAGAVLTLVVWGLVSMSNEPSSIPREVPTTYGYPPR